MSRPSALGQAATPPPPGRGSERAAGDAPPPRRNADAILGHAEMLGIPWRRLLEAEVDAELALRRCEVEIASDDDLALALCVLSRAALESWRVRDRVEALCGAAAVAGSQIPLRRLLRFVRGLAGGAEPDRSLRRARRVHCRQAYRRIRELVALAREAAQDGSEGRGDGVRLLVERTRCSLPDAEWAFAAASSPGAASPLERAVRRAREEGFQIPIAGSERAAYRILRDWVAASRRPRRLRSAGPAKRTRKPIRAASLRGGPGTLDAHPDS